MRVRIIKLVGDTVENKESKDQKNSFKLSSFIKKKILGMYGIKKSSTSYSPPEDLDSTENPISSLLPHEDNKL